MSGLPLAHRELNYRATFLTPGCTRASHHKLPWYAGRLMCNNSTQEVGTITIELRIPVITMLHASIESFGVDVNRIFLGQAFLKCLDR